jgi:hypothetical protein
MNKHVSAKIEQVLSLSNDELEAMFEGKAAEIRAELEERKANGEILIAAEVCEGFDPVKGCPGHEEKAAPKPKPAVALWQIANYLDYELEVKAHDKVAPGVLVSICTGMAGLLLFYEKTDTMEYYDMCEIKPMLRPLKELVLDNPKTGKPFYFDVLSAACEMPFQGKNNKFWKPLFTGSQQVTIEELNAPKYLEIDNNYNDYSFSIDLENGDLSVYRNGELATTDYQANYIQALYKHHFDVHGLLEKGLAVLKVLPQ